MKTKASGFIRIYEAAMRSQLDRGTRLETGLIEKASVQIRTNGMSVLEFAKLHERVLVEKLLPGIPAGKHAVAIRNAGNFFAAVILMVDLGNGNTRDAARLRKTIESLSVRTVELASANRLLDVEIIERGKAEAKLRKSEQNLTNSLEKSELLKDQLRGLSRQILSFQEDERKKLSRELHDVVAQALLGITFRLATLKNEAKLNSRELERNIAQTQKVITKSAGIIYQFARELRPPVLDDLGLIPTLQSFMKNFTTRTGVRTHLAVFPGVEKLTVARRTVLYRVAQESLTNVSRHAHASRVMVTIRRDGRFVIMEIGDDGKSFRADEVLLSRNTKRLGLLGMRERIEMVGGRFEIESILGKGTKIIARIPVSKTTERKWQEEG